MNKKKQKNFIRFVAALAAGLVFDGGGLIGFAEFSPTAKANRRSHGQKFFASFFQKRRPFLPLA